MTWGNWATVADLATALGTLVLAVATFSAVKSANLTARVAQRSPLVGLRPVLMASRREFERQNRDLYIPVGDIGFWPGAFREPADPRYEPARKVVKARQPWTVELLYGDHEGGQRCVTRFTMLPRQHHGPATNPATDPARDPATDPGAERDGSRPRADTGTSTAQIPGNTAPWQPGSPVTRDHRVLPWSN